MIFRSFRYRNFRLFFLGQGVSLIGFWLQQIAVSWLVYRMTNSPIILGLSGFLDKLPMFFIGPFAGVLVDRWNRLRTVTVTQTLAMLQAFVLGTLTATGVIEVWHILVLGFCQGLIFCLDIPARQSLLMELVEEKADFNNVIALNSSLVHSARMIGPAMAGFLIAYVGEGPCFLINGFSYLAVIAALLAIKLPKKPRQNKPRKIVEELKEGFRYAFGHPALRSLLLLVAWVSFTAMPYIILMPIFSSDILRGGPKTLGFLMGASGAGALCGALFLASQKNTNLRSEERRVGKECRSRWSPYH